jgi:hypothetical protein
VNRKVLDFARGRIGQKVADGRCMRLAFEALRYAGAQRYPFDPNGDFVWGRPVASFKEALFCEDRFHLPKIGMEIDLGRLH